MPLESTLDEIHRRAIRNRWLRLLTSLTRALLAVAFLAISVRAQQQPASEKTPEGVIRALVRAMYANDIPAFERLTIPDPRRHRLVSGGRVNESALKEIDEDPDAVQIKLKRDFQLRGRPVTPNEAGDYPVGTTVLYMVAHRGGPMMVSITRRPEGWRVDLRWWLAMVEMSSGPAPQPGSAAYAVRALIASLLTLDRKQAARFAMPGASLELLFAGAPSQREPSGHLDALVAEMPLVEIGPGEFFVMPSGRIVEGLRRADTKLLLGVYGSIEMPFIVHLVGREWRVEAEPYFATIMR